MNCLIIDDENLAIKVIENHLSYFPDVHIIGKYHSALEAMKAIYKVPVDLIFLDIEMPRMDGLSFIRTLSDNPMVVLTTAHRGYALESYELSVIDYLLKPIGFERFAHTMQKCYKQIKTNAPLLASHEDKSEEMPDSIFVKADREYVKIDLGKILYIESIKNHVRLHLPDRKITTHLSISTLQEKLPNNQFVRIHKSFIANLNQVSQFTQANLTINGQLLPIGRIYKPFILGKLKSRSINNL